MKRSYKRRPSHLLEKTRGEVALLFDTAELLWRKGDVALATRRVAQARRAAMKVQLRIPEQGERFCRRCNAVLIPGENVTFRIKDGVRIRRCGECGTLRRRMMRRK